MLSQRFFRPAAAGVARSLSVRATGAEFHERIKGDADTPGRPFEERGASFTEWDYSVGPSAFAEELTEYVKKFTAVSAT